MKTVEIVGRGDHAALEIGKREIPNPKSGEVLIKVFAAGVNRADILQRKGKYPAPEGASDILGLEVAGEITKIGEDVSGWKVGDKVCALLEGGGYADYALAHYTQVLPIPANLDYIQAAALPEACFTVWSNLFFHAKMRAGESLLVHGGTSGIGIMAVRTAQAFGIKCFATAGSDEKCNFLRDLGVDLAINYKTQDFVDMIAEQTGGVDVVLDMVGGDYFQKNLSVLAYGGRLVCISFLQGAKAEVNFTPILIKNLTIMGTTLRNKQQKFKADIAIDLKNKVWPFIENGSIKPVIDSVLSLEDANKAHDLMQSSQHIGKIVLKLA
jgi:NADPH2:quinone reductase